MLRWPGRLRKDDPRSVAGYRIIRWLGKGGQGDVYLGKSGSGQKVAVKVRPPEKDAELHRFRKEVEAARMVPSRYTARLLTSGETAEYLYIVTEYVDGLSLQEKIEGRIGRAGPVRGGEPRGLAPADWRRTAVGTILALAEFHRLGVVHRDFKPANVLCGEGLPRVIDFGIARNPDSTVTLGAGLVGTPAYMSPEQFARGEIGPPSDVFSWAVTMAYAATGKHPFHRDLVRLQAGDPDLAVLEESWRPLFGRCLAKDPSERPTAAEIVALLAPDQVPEWTVQDDAPAADGPQAVRMDPPATLSPALPPGPRVRRLPRLDSPPLKAAAGLLSGVMLVTVPWWMWEQYDRRFGDCPQPVELRAMAPPELQETYREAAQRFVEEEADGGCRPVHVTVFPQPSLEAARSGMRNAWAERLPTDPQPDVWLPMSAAEVEYVRPPEEEKPASSERSLPKLEIKGDTGIRSAMSVVATPAAWTVLEQDRQKGLWSDLPGLLEQADERDIPVLRPNPDNAASGTLGSLGFYSDPGVKKDKGRLAAFERQVTRRPITDARAALCAANELPEAVAIIPRQVAVEHEDEFGEGGACGAPLASLAVGGLHRLDHPFVRVTWPGNGDGARDEYAERFRVRLTEHPPEKSRAWPPGSLPLAPETLAETQNLFKQTRGGRTVEFLFDLSGTMGLDSPGGVPLLTAQTLTRDVLAELRENDRVGLSVFPSEGGGRDPEERLESGPVDPERILRLREEVDDLKADEKITPLYRALEVRGKALNARRPPGALVVFTDGIDDDVSEAAGQEAAVAVGSEQGKPGAPRVVFVVLGGEKCADGVKTLDEDWEQVACVAAEDHSSYEELRTRLLVEIWEG